MILAKEGENKREELLLSPREDMVTHWEHSEMLKAGKRLCAFKACAGMEGEDV